MTKYLLIYRSPVTDTPPPQPSPEEMQAMFAAWDAWKSKFKREILDMGDGLNPGGRVLGADDKVTDGPFVEAKEVLGGFSIVQAESYEQALDVARACPVRQMPGSSVEIREMAGLA